MIRIFSTIIFSLSLLVSTAFCADPILPNANNFIKSANSNGILTANEIINDIDDKISGGLTSILIVLYQVGIVIAVCLIAFMAIKFIVASPQQKADLKNSFYPYFIGFLLLIAGVPLAIIIINIFISIF